VLVDQLIARNHLSAIVVTASGLGTNPYPGILTYSCTKVFADFLARGLNFELKGKIDCLSWKALEVSTNMMKKPVGGRVVSTKTAVTGMLRDLGKENQTYGCFTHASSLFWNMPLSLV
jgi:short-subunit dehydrogenase